jgi:hypothetical protein
VGGENQKAIIVVFCALDQKVSLARGSLSCECAG